MECSIRHAELKSVDLKNTQVTFTRKKVPRARIKFLRFFGWFISGVKDAITTFLSGAVINVFTPDDFRISRTAFSIHKYSPCNAPQATKVHFAPCQSPPSNIVIIRLKYVLYFPALFPPKGMYK